MQVFLSYFFNSYRPKWRFSKVSFNQLAEYGRWMLGSAVFWFLYSQGALAFSGLIFSVTVLGLYQMANRFATLPSSLFGETLLASFFPIYANLQKSKERVRLGFLKALQLSSLIIFSSTVLVAFGFPAFFVFFVGNQWIDAIGLIAPIAFAGGLMALLRTSSPLFLGIGKPRYQFFLDFLQTSVMLALLYPLGKWMGLVGLPYAMLIGSFFALLVWWRGIRLSLDLTLADIFKALFSSGLSSIVLVIILWLTGVPVVLLPLTGLVLFQKVLMISIAVLAFIIAYLFAERLVPGYLPSIELWKLASGQIKRLWKKKVLNPTEG
jgi:PST family polysaccharide transporter/lipopolysaccharide exporter